jgi:hypothetical protein
MKHIEVTIKKVYGNRVIYPVCPTARDFARIAGTKTLTPETLRRVRDLGYSIREVYPSQLDEVLK